MDIPERFQATDRDREQNKLSEALGEAMDRMVDARSPLCDELIRLTTDKRDIESLERFISDKQLTAEEQFFVDSVIAIRRMGK